MRGRVKQSRIRGGRGRMTNSIVGVHYAALVREQDVSIYESTLKCLHEIDYMWPESVVSIKLSFVMRPFISHLLHDCF